MGEQGAISRVLSVRAGLPLPSLPQIKGSPPPMGHITAREMQETYRVDQLDAATRIVRSGRPSGATFAVAGAHQHRHAAGKCQCRLPASAG